MSKKLIYYGGCGYEGLPEKGLYKVTSPEGHKKFVSLSDARNYFDNLEIEKALWLITEKSELIECFNFQDENSTDEMPF